MSKQMDRNMAQMQTVMAVNLVDLPEDIIIKKLTTRLVCLENMLGCNACVICKGDKCPRVTRRHQ